MRGERIRGYVAQPRGAVVRDPRGTLGEAHDSYRDALQACEAASDCIGVSTDWYIAAAWQPVLSDGSFQVDAQSYGCTMFLDCSGS